MKKSKDPKHTRLAIKKEKLRFLGSSSLEAVAGGKCKFDSCISGEHFTATPDVK